MTTLPTTHPTTVLYEVSDHIATLTLNRPDRLNAYPAALGAELRQAMRRASDDADVRVIILTGAVILFLRVHSSPLTACCLKLMRLPQHLFQTSS